MKTKALGVILACLLAPSLLTGDECHKPTKPTKAQKADDLAAKMEKMRDDYQELLAECWGKGYYLQEPQGPVWQLSDAPDAKACKKAEALKTDYRAAYKKLLKLDRARVIFENVPMYIDRP